MHKVRKDLFSTWSISEIKKWFTCKHNFIKYHYDCDVKPQQTKLPIRRRNNPPPPPNVHEKTVTPEAWNPCRSSARHNPSPGQRMAATPETRAVLQHAVPSPLANGRGSNYPCRPSARRTLPPPLPTTGGCNYPWDPCRPSARRTPPSPFLTTAMGSNHPWYPLRHSTRRNPHLPSAASCNYLWNPCRPSARITVDLTSYSPGVGLIRTPLNSDPWGLKSTARAQFSTDFSMKNFDSLRQGDCITTPTTDKIWTPPLNSCRDFSFSYQVPWF